MYSSNIFGQVPNWSWAISQGGANNDYPSSTTIDTYGNLYVAGNFASPFIVFGNDTLLNNGTYDIFIAKYDASGNLIWAKDAGGSNGDIVEGIATDLLGNVYITGSSYNFEIGTATLSNSGWVDMFIVKLDALGNLVWLDGAGGNSFDSGKSITTDTYGNIYVTGNYSSPSITFGSFTLTNSGGNDIFIVKYDTSGSVIWARSEGNIGSEIVNSITSDFNNNIYITGNYSSPTINFGTTSLSNAGIEDIYLVKYDNLGNVIWAKSEGSTGTENANYIVTDNSGNIYITGYYGSASISFGTNLLTNSDSLGNFPDIFILKFDSLGNEIWSNGFGSFGNDVGNCITIDSSGNFYVLGDYTSLALSFGAVTLINEDTTGNSHDVFLLKYDATGNLLWVKGVGGSYNDIGTTVSSDLYGNLFITGQFSTNITFDSATLTNTGATDMFIAYLGATLVDINENSIVTQTTLNPNPFDYLTAIYFGKYVDDGVLNVYDIRGQLIKSKINISGNSTSLYRESLPSGIYFIELLDDNQVIDVKKVVIID